MEPQLTQPDYMSELQNRDQHILSLQSQLLRVDYEYGVMVKNLKKELEHTNYQKEQIALGYSEKAKKYKKFLREYKNQCKQLKEANEKLEGEKQKWEIQFAGLNEKIKCLEVQKQNIKRESKYVENNYNKLEMKNKEVELKCHQYRKLSEKIGLQNKEMKKKIKQMQEKIGEYENFIENQAQIMPAKVQNLKLTFFNQLKSFKSIESVQLTNNPEKPEKISQKSITFDTDWETDMKKLKNCCDYAENYILSIEASDFDRGISREVFIFLRSIIKAKNQISKRHEKLSKDYQSVIEELKKKLNYFEVELLHLNQKNSNEMSTSVASVQTSPLPKIEQNSKNSRIFSQMVSKERLKNEILKKAIQKSIFKQISYLRVIEDQKSLIIWSGKKVYQKRNDSSQKLKKVFLSIFFLQVLKKKAKISRKIKQRLEIKENSFLADPLQTRIFTLSLKYYDNTIQNGFYTEMHDFLNKLTSNEDEMNGRMIDLLNFTRIKVKKVDENEKICLK